MLKKLLSYLNDRQTALAYAQVMGVKTKWYWSVAKIKRANFNAHR